MIELVERYVHQIGLYLPKNERADIEAELRSSIRDQLKDRFGESPTQADVAAVLTAMGDPRRMAASYARGQSLIGPDLYPYLMMVLWRVWVIVPTLVIFLGVFGALVSARQVDWARVLLDTLSGVVQATFMSSALVVLLFAIIERIGSRADQDQKEADFNPLQLPKVNDPRAIERSELIFGAIFGVFMIGVLIYFASAGGLRLPFSGNNPGDVIPVPIVWLLLLTSAVIGMIGIHLTVLRLNRWSGVLWMLQTLFEVFGMICLYFMFYTPILARLIATMPSLADAPIVGSIPQILVIITALSTLAVRGSRQVALWSFRSAIETPIASHL